MNRFATLLTMLGLAAGATGVAVAYYPIATNPAVVSTQADCAMGEAWNVQSQACQLTQ